MGKLDGKVAIVTGASSGMGREIAKLFALEGAKVIAVARRKERLEELAGESDGSIIPFPADVTDDERIYAAVDMAVNDFGKIDILVNNAGVMDSMVPAADVTDEQWNRIFDINVTSLMKLSRKALNSMLENESGNIINIASVGGLQGDVAGAAYSASKHAVIGYTRNLGYQYAVKGIRCNAICPGGVNTEIAESGMKDLNKFGLERAQLGMASIPRQGEAKEIATIALFLASDDSSFVNATTIVADAGWEAI